MTITTTYDALGRMVEKSVSGTYTQIVYSPLGAKFAVMSGQTLQKAWVPLPTGAQAIYTSAGLAYYRHHDHLGSSRLATTPSRTMYSSTAYAPYGEPYAQAGTTDLSFTGQDQDTTSGMHDFLDRKYNPVQGRWLSPDPMGLGAVNPASPQSWNRYAYVVNNPLALVDPFGDEEYRGCGNGHAYVGCGWTVGIGGGGSCILDGAETDCGLALPLLDNGAAAVCPNNFCSGFVNGEYKQFIAGAGGAQGYINLSDLSKGLNEVNGQFYTDDQYNQYIRAHYAGAIEAQRQALAKAIAANSGGTISYQDAYDSLQVEGGHLQGGNYNFVSQYYDPGDLGCGADASRCNGIHFPGPDASGDRFVHLDTSNPFASPFGFLEHGFVDLFLGNVAYTVIPRPWP